MKFAVSISVDEFRDLEYLRKKQGLTRSAFISQAIKLWKEIRKRKRLAKLYIAGYKKIPEDLSEIRALEKASSDALSANGWQ